MDVWRPCQTRISSLPILLSICIEDGVCINLSIVNVGRFIPFGIIFHLNFVEWSVFKLKYKVPPFGNRTGTHRKVKLKYLLTPPRLFRVTFLFGPYWKGVSHILLLDEMAGHICEQIVFGTRNVDKFQTVTDF
jgi:hypothetical protein